MRARRHDCCGDSTLLFRVSKTDESLCHRTAETMSRKLCSYAGLAYLLVFIFVSILAVQFMIGFKRGSLRSVDFSRFTEPSSWESYSAMFEAYARKREMEERRILEGKLPEPAAKETFSRNPSSSRSQEGDTEASERARSTSKIEQSPKNTVPSSDLTNNGTKASQRSRPTPNMEPKEYAGDRPGPTANTTSQSSSHLAKNGSEGKSSHPEESSLTKGGSGAPRSQGSAVKAAREKAHEEPSKGQTPFLLYSNSVPKSGSTVLFKYQQYYFNSKFQRNSLDEIKSFFKGIGGVGHFLYGIDHNINEKLVNMTRAEGPGLVKTHVGGLAFDSELEKWIKSGAVKMSLIHRDLRDVLLSARNHAMRTRNTPRAPFQEFLNFTSERALMVLRNNCLGARKLIKSGLVCTMRYVDLLTNPVDTLEENFKCLGIVADRKILQRAVEADERDRKRGVGLENWNTGKPSRYKEELPKESLKVVNEWLGECLRDLGYDG